MTLTLAAEGLSIPQETIDDFVRGILESQVPDGFVLKSEQVETDFVLVDEVEEGTWDFDVSIIANLLPDVNPDEIVKQIAGKYRTQAETYLRTIPGYTGAEIRIRPSFPGRLGNIPRVLGNITVEIVAER